MLAATCHARSAPCAARLRKHPADPFASSNGISPAARASSELTRCLSSFLLSTPPQVHYTGFSTISTLRLGQRFVGKVANPNDMVLWQKAAARKQRVGRVVGLLL